MSIKPRFIISDLHFGDGQSTLEDFDATCTEQFVKFLGNVTVLGGAKLIINGDLIDFPQIPLAQKSPPPQPLLGTTEDESVERLQKSINGHPEEFAALQRFLAKPGNELVLIAGNHDIDFCWNRVLRLFRQRIGATDQNFHFGLVYKESGLFVTHGHQFSDDNRIDVPIELAYNRLNNCWGTVFVEQFFNRVEERYPLLDNARPTWKVALSAILHEELIVTAQFAATFLTFFKQFGMPLTEYVSSGLFGWKPKKRALRKRDVNAVLVHVPLDELRDRLQALRGNPKFKQEFDASFEMLEERQWTRLITPPENSAQSLRAQLQPEDTEIQSRDLFGHADNYQEAAKLIATHHPGVQVVVMGHTHTGLDAQALEQDAAACAYYNTGTWTRTYEIPWWQLPRIEKLANSRDFTSNSGVVRCTRERESFDVKYVESWDQALT